MAWPLNTLYLPTRDAKELPSQKLPEVQTAGIVPAVFFPAASQGCPTGARLRLPALTRRSLEALRAFDDPVFLERLDAFFSTRFFIRNVLEAHRRKPISTPPRGGNVHLKCAD